MASRTKQITKLVRAMVDLFVSLFISHKRFQNYEISMSDLDFDLRKKRESNYLGEM